MLDIGWSELLVIAIVLIVVVGPKDLPPMIRAFGKTMAGLRKMAGDFRSQFDEALKEADMDDVRQTISDVRNLNPTNSLRDAINPLRQLGNDIRADLQSAATPPSSPATSAPVGAPPVSLDEPEMTLPDGPPPAVAPVPVAPAVSTAAAAPVSVQSAASPRVAAAPAETQTEKPKRVRKAPAKSEQEIEAETVAAKPKRVPRTIAAKTDAKKAKPSSIADMAAEPAITPALTKVAAKAAKPQTAKTSAEKPAATKKAASVKSDIAVSVKKTKTAKAKKDEA